jgi:hypothetical protein
MRPLDTLTDRYPLIAAVLADLPLPKLSKPQFWKRNFVQTKNRPAKRLGIELKTFFDWNRNKHPRGSYVTPKDLIRILNMSDKERVRIPMVIEYLLARKTIQKTSIPDKYRLI